MHFTVSGTSLAPGAPLAQKPSPRPPKAWTVPGAPAPSGVPLGAPQAARFALNDLASTAPRQTLAPRGARGTPLRPHTGQYASQAGRRPPNKQVLEQNRQSSTADLVARNAAAGTTKAKNNKAPITRPPIHRAWVGGMRGAIKKFRVM